MELWEAIEAIAGRELDFTTDVIILNNGDGDFDTDDIVWNVPDVEHPSIQDIEDMMSLEPFLKLKLDVNKFIWDIKKGVSIIPDEVGFTTHIINHAHVDEPYVDEINNLPLFKLVENNIIPVTDPLDYQVDLCLWNKYVLKYQREITTLLRVKTNEQMRELWRSEPEYRQKLIFDAIQYFWSDMVNQWNVNLTMEVMARVVLEKLYIENVENRQMSADEQASFNYILSQVHSSAGMLKNNPSEEGPNLSMTHWYNYFLTQVSQTSSILTQQAFNQRTFVCSE